MIEHLQDTLIEPIPLGTNANDVRCSGLDIIEFVKTERAGGDSSLNALVVDDRHHRISQTKPIRCQNSSRDLYPCSRCSDQHIARHVGGREKASSDGGADALQHWSAGERYGI